MEPFDPPDAAWVRVSPKLATVRRLGLLATLVPLTFVGTVLLWLLDLRGWAGALFAAGVLVAGWAWLVIGRSVRSWGYAERDDDLLITRGILYRQLVVVPYGRMQFVDVTAGPLDRRLGLATVQLHTAAATTNATIPGLDPAEAARLRDRLAARGEAHAAGL